MKLKYDYTHKDVPTNICGLEENLVLFSSHLTTAAITMLIYIFVEFYI